MPHVREQLAVAVVARLTGLTTTGARVYRQRPQEYALQPVTELPALRVFLLGDQASASGIGVPFYERIASLRIDGVAKVSLGTTAGTNPLDTLLNLIASEVETALATEIEFAVGKTTLLLYRGTTVDDSAAGDQPVGVVAMTWDAVIYTNHGAPDVSLEA